MSKISARCDHADAVVGEIITLVSRCTQVPEEDIRGRRRTAQIAYARQKTMAVARLRGLHYAQIGRALDRDHSTVIQACKKLGVA